MNEWINEWNENWKNDKLDYIKKENFCSLKNTVKGSKFKPLSGRKGFVIHMSHKVSYLEHVKNF